jgi:hypothetical protein
MRTPGQLLFMGLLVGGLQLAGTHPQEVKSLWAELNPSTSEAANTLPLGLPVTALARTASFDQAGQGAATASMSPGLQALFAQEHTRRSAMERGINQSISSR